MITQALWTLIAIQIAMGAFDTLVHHELTERLAWRPSQRRELQLHGARNLIYAALFLTLGWLEPRGLWAVTVIALLVIEVIITLVDFVEEDMTRRLPASERVNHTLLALNYGVILALLVPVLLGWSWLDTGIASVSYGWWSLFATLSAIGVALFGLRDLAAARRCLRLAPAPASELVQALVPGQVVLVTGASGFIGQRLCEALAAGGHEVIALLRNPAKADALRAPYRLVTSLDQIADRTKIDAIVNLAGEPIANRLWSPARRRQLTASRVGMTQDVVRLIARLTVKPGVLVSGSAIGWYGVRGDEALTETAVSKPCFSHELCAAWEAAAGEAARHGVRVVLLRTGIVLGTQGGVLTRLLTPFEFGLGGRFGDGRHWMSWITRDDLVRLIAHAIADARVEGPLNGTAPNPVRNSDFTRALASALHRPALLPVPAAPLRWIAGDLARELLLGGQKVLPEKAVAAGFEFRDAEIGAALAKMLGAR